MPPWNAQVNPCEAGPFTWSLTSLFRTRNWQLSCNVWIMEMGAHPIRANMGFTALNLDHLTEHGIRYPEAIKQSLFADRWRCRRSSWALALQMHLDSCFYMRHRTLTRSIGTWCPQCWKSSVCSKKTFLSIAIDGT